jgi:transcriptional regulator with XRE-family HTH domain
MSTYKSHPPTDDEVAELTRQLATLLASRIQHLRTARGWSTRTLYERSGVSTSTQNEVRNGVFPDISTILRLALTFDIDSLEEMFGAHLPTSSAFEIAGLQAPGPGVTAEDD